MNIITYLKVGGIVAIALGIFAGYKYVDHLQSENIRLEKENTTLTTSNEEYKKKIGKLESRIKENSVELAELNYKISKSRERSEKLMKLFSRHDFTDLVQKKPQLIENRINKATEKVFENLERLSKQ